MVMLERIDHPPHYTSHPSGIECITIVEHMTFNVGSAIKYLWRVGLKSIDASNASQRVAKLVDMRKALWYIEREISRLEKETNHNVSKV